MESISLAQGSIRTSRLGFGCAGLMRSPTRRARQAVLAAAFEGGIRHFDVARMYGLGAAEGELGAFAADGRRESMVIATKFGIEAPGGGSRLARLQGPARALLNRYPRLRHRVKRREASGRAAATYDGASARASLETSLRELQTDYVDLLFLHDPSPLDVVRTDDVCEYLEAARQAGHLRAWGVAGEPGIGSELTGQFSVPTVLQVRDDIFRSAPRRGEVVTFGVLDGALNRIRTYVQGDSTRRARWSDALEVGDCSWPDLIASLLLRDALVANSEGVVLFSTTRPDRIVTAVEAAERTAAPDASLVAFQALVESEIGDGDSHGGPTR